VTYRQAHRFCFLGLPCALPSHRLPVVVDTPREGAKRGNPSAQEAFVKFRGFSFAGLGAFAELFLNGSCRFRFENVAAVGETVEQRGLGAELSSDRVRDRANRADPVPRTEPPRPPRGLRGKPASHSSPTLRLPSPNLNRRPSHAERSYRPSCGTRNVKKSGIRR
jgi:hypothetical protein